MIEVKAIRDIQMQHHSGDIIGLIPLGTKGLMNEEAQMYGPTEYIEIFWESPLRSMLLRRVEINDAIAVIEN